MLGARGPWKKLREIGKGSFGLVFLVQKQNGDERKFVMKEVNLRGLPKSEMLSAQNEVSVLKKLQHPHIIRIEEAIVVDDTLCIVMEWAEGKDLGALVAERKQQNRPFTEDEVLKIFWQLTSALAYCHHELHMLHRDLKPQNVFLAANGDVKLGDFGLAKVIEATCALAKTQCGTPLYMSPELCMGQAYNRAADVYALGCILFELTTLTAPWADVRVNAAGGISALLKRIANSSLDLSPVKRRYSLELSNLLASLIHKRGDCRPALSQVLQLDLVKKAAPKPPSDDERKLPPSWRKVPSQSRPGQFSYVHVPTGYKQAHFPERDELPEEVLAALKKQTFAPGHPARPPPPTAQKPPAPAANMRPDARPSPRPSPRGHAPVAPTPPPPPPVPTGARVAPSPHTDATEGVLPPSWRKVPSASRPGSFSYVHVPTGYKQAEFPTSDTPDPAMFAAWKAARAAATAVRGSPATAAVGAPPRTPHGGFGRLERVDETPGAKTPGAKTPGAKTPGAKNVLTPHGQVNRSPFHAANPFDFRTPGGQNKQLQHQRGYQPAQRPRY